MLDVTQRNKQVKQALSKHYKRGDVSVKGDRGTAYGWCRVKVILDNPKGCQCKIETLTNTWAKTPYTYRIRGKLNDNYDRSEYMCSKCLALYKKNYDKVRKIVHNCGAEFFHYYADDGYNTRHAEVLIDVEVRI